MATFEQGKSCSQGEKGRVRPTANNRLSRPCELKGSSRMGKRERGREGKKRIFEERDCSLQYVEPGGGISEDRKRTPNSVKGGKTKARNNGKGKERRPASDTTCKKRGERQERDLNGQTAGRGGGKNTVERKGERRERARLQSEL